ncbi:DUF4097 family beta strand repeat-containing protein [Kineothrix sp. MB12-C1]|uniref:DUF4097 family beta strand repeat-containing protein n=1 Tax=Kineothrix sp. MB12-C1 TaxID=3070215 RepID=UPI0027D2B02C|nr:DUF4097 family beta strand repeat-containing protein [Kineothrix sp. MB12-C1]WMC91920.1 DUF4097 family beta strand repeat-containing protein [Kineothrix sp. MB12-C1]
MKKFTKVCLFTSLILILFGGVIFVIGAASGGWRQAQETSRNDAWWKVLDRVSYAYGRDYFDDFDNFYDDDFDDNDDGYNTRNVSDSDRKQAGGSVNKENVDKLEISIGAAALYIEESKSGNFEMVKDGVGKYQYYESSGVLYLKGNQKNIVRNNEKVYLYIPAGMTFEEISIELGAGLIEVGELNADEVEISVGAGLLEADKVISRNLSVDVGAGKVTLQEVDTEELDIETGLGYVYAAGSVTKEIDVECAMGSVELELAGSETDYNYEVKSEVGTIAIGKNSYSTLSKKTHINNNATAKCSVECAMGNIEISFLQ